MQSDVPQRKRARLRDSAFSVRSRSQIPNSQTCTKHVYPAAAHHAGRTKGEPTEASPASSTLVGVAGRSGVTAASASRRLAARAQSAAGLQVACEACAARAAPRLHAALQVQVLPPPGVPGCCPRWCGRPLQAPTFARTPRCLALCWQGARRGDNEVLEAHVNMMLNIFADAWRFQDMESDMWAQRLQKNGTRFY